LCELVSVVEDPFYDFVLGDESEDFHLGTASFADQRVDLVDTVDELSPSFVRSASSGSRRWLLLVTNGVMVASSHAIGVGAIKMDEMLAGLWNRPHSGCFEGIRCCGAASKDCPPQNMNENSGQELEWVGQSIVVEMFTFGLVEK
jgi:hypothetical protein